MLLNAREEYGLVKNKAFDVLDDVRDIHNAVESAEHRITTNAKKMRKYLDKKAEWKYQHKYSTRTTKACIMDKDTVGELVNKLRQDWNDYPQLLTNMADTTLATLISHKMTKQEECVSLSTPAPKPVFNNTRPTRPTRPVTPPTDDTSGSPWTEL
jgi:DNA topoisomerase VI subunit B